MKFLQDKIDWDISFRVHDKLNLLFKNNVQFRQINEGMNNRFILEVAEEVGDLFIGKT